MARFVNADERTEVDMFEESFPDKEPEHFCRVVSSFRCKDSSAAWAESYGTGEDCDEAQNEMFEMYTELCNRMGEGDPIFRTTDWSCSCDRG